MNSICFLCKNEIGRFSKKYPKSELDGHHPRDMSDADLICNKCYDAGVEKGKMFRKELSEQVKIQKSERFEDLRRRVDQYKPLWDKDGVIQYKDEFVAILQRKWGVQVEFIIAYSDLTKDGYELKAIDEGKTGGQASGGFTGGLNSYYYFQKKEYLK